MIIQCEQCRTKFKLDDEKVSDRGVRVRCARCRHVFKVSRPDSGLETAPEVMATGLGASAFAAADEPAFIPATDPVPPEISASFTEEPETGFNFVELPEETAPVETALTPEPEPSVEIPAPVAEEPPMEFDFGEIPEPVAGADETVLMTAPPASPAAMPSSFAEEPVVDFSFGEVSEAAISKDASFDLGLTDAAPAAQVESIEFGEISFAEAAPESSPEPPAWGDETVVIAPVKQPEPEPEAGFDFGVADVAVQPEAPAVSGFDFGTVLAQTAEEPAEKDISFDFGDAVAAPAAVQTPSFDFTAKPEAAFVAAPDVGTDVDFGSFDFGDISVAKPDDGGFAFDAGSIDVAAAPKASAVAAPEGDFGFAFDDAQVSQPAPPASGGGEFGFSFDDAAASKQEAEADHGGFDLSSVDFGAAEGAAAAAPAQTVSDFSIGDMDFATDSGPVSVHEDSVDKGSAALTAFGEQPAQSLDALGTLAAAVPPPVQPAQDFSFEPVAQHHEEASPLSISSRRRQSPVISVIIGAVFVVILGILGYMGFQMAGGEKSAPAEDGRIAVQNVNAYFMPRTAAGELLVINGEVVNNFKKPRASLQVKAMLFAQDNTTPVLFKVSFAGNQLTREQLAAMPAEKIEASMNNQFGDSLSNLEVQPGKSIPFTVVIINPPATAKEYGVEPVGSTVAAAGK